MKKIFVYFRNKRGETKDEKVVGKNDRAGKPVLFFLLQTLFWRSEAGKPEKWLSRPALVTFRAQWLEWGKHIRREPYPVPALPGAFRLVLAVSHSPRMADLYNTLLDV
ncbi:MAG TPA: hypothetical protein HPP81_10885 [Deltaproteobacteria bacterium]|jgi:hypothetical protein|nr:hypothetical protein [Deltaproteobacteria bacterium]HIJ77202.1 hypothetical protein [Deltaproteobacteria bacterium]